MSLIRRLPAALTGLALVAACGDSSGPLDNDQLDEIGAALRDEVEASSVAFTVFGATLGLPLCVGGSGEGSSDTDIVPDSVRFVFSVPPCSYSNVRDGGLEVSGLVDILDPVPDADGFDYLVRMGNLGYRYVSPRLEDNYTVIRNGTRTRTGTEQALSQDVNLDVRRTLAVEVVTVREHWTVTLTPSGGAPLATDEAIPDASITIAGTFEYSRSGQQYSLDVTTPTPLTYDTDCNDTMQRIRAGELRAAGTIEGQEGYVQLVWNDCGDAPDVRFVAAGG
jgi:hypothetical protein